MKATFNVTYDIVTPESAEHGDLAESGFYAENVTLREAVDALYGMATEADCCPVSVTYPPRWLTNYEAGEDYATGAIESRSLHFDDSITPASRIRLARLMGCYGVA
jgi:hypothetical protein